MKVLRKLGCQVVFFVTSNGREYEYMEGGRQWAQDDAQHTWLNGEGKWFRLEDQLEDFCKQRNFPTPRKMNTTTHILSKLL